MQSTEERRTFDQAPADVGMSFHEMHGFNLHAQYCTSCSDNFCLLLLIARIQVGSGALASVPQLVTAKTTLIQTIKADLCATAGFYLLNSRLCMQPVSESETDEDPPQQTNLSALPDRIGFIGAGQVLL